MIIHGSSQRVDGVDETEGFEMKSLDQRGKTRRGVIKRDWTPVSLSFRVSTKEMISKNDDKKREREGTKTETHSLPKLQGRD